MPYHIKKHNNSSSTDTLTRYYSDCVIDLNQFDELGHALQEHKIALTSSEQFNLLLIVKGDQHHALLEILNYGNTMQVKIYYLEQESQYHRPQFLKKLTDKLRTDLAVPKEKIVQINTSSINRLTLYTLLLDCGLNNRRITDPSTLIIADDTNPVPESDGWKKSLKAAIVAALGITLIVAIALNFVVPGALLALMAMLKLGSIATTFLVSTGCGIAGGTAMGGATIWAYRMKAKRDDEAVEAAVTKQTP